MKTYKTAILGATGAVGREMIRILEERRFPVGELVALASEKSVGTSLRFRGEEVCVRLAHAHAFDGCDIVLGAASSDVARRFADDIVGAGAVFIDNSSAFRMDDGVPLVVPEINAEDVKTHRGIIANPNCSTIIAFVAVNAINKLSPIKSMTVSTYQAVSGAGAGGPKELLEQTSALTDGRAVKPDVFRYQIAYNLIPHIGDFLSNGYTTEEMKMQNEGRKIMHLPNLLVGCTCVRVPVVRCHSISISLVTKRQVSVDDAREAISAAAGCRLVDDSANFLYPMPLDTSDQDLVCVGRVRRDIASGGIALWCCGDQLRKGAATNAVEIAEKVIGS